MQTSVAAGYIGLFEGIYFVSEMGGYRWAHKYIYVYNRKISTQTSWQML